MFGIYDFCLPLTIIHRRNGGGFLDPFEIKIIIFSGIAQDKRFLAVTWRGSSSSRDENLVLTGLDCFGGAAPLLCVGIACGGRGSSIGAKRRFLAGAALYAVFFD